MYMCTKIIEDDKNLSVVQIPTGIGKSFISVMLAYYYKREKQKNYAIVTTEDFLVE